MIDYTIYESLKNEIQRMRYARPEDLFSVLQVLYALYHNYTFERKNRDEFYLTPKEGLLPPSIRVVATNPALERTLSALSNDLFDDRENCLSADNYHELMEMTFANLSRTSHISVASTIYPLELSALYRHIILQYNCHSVYNPFAGMASIGAALYGTDIKYCGQEISSETFKWAQYRLDASKLHYKLMFGDSIRDWQHEHFDAVVAMQPWGVRLNDGYRDLNLRTVRTFDDYFYYRAFEANNSANVIVGCSSVAFCMSSRNCETREMLCQKRVIDTIIELPEVLRSSISPRIIIVTPNKEHDAIRFINAKNALIKDSRKKVLDVDAIIRLMDKPTDEVLYVDYNKIYEQNYMLDSMYYREVTEDLQEGQSLVPLSHFAEFDRGVLTRGDDMPDCKVIVAADFSNNIFDIIHPALDEGEHVPFQNVTYRLLHGPHLVLSSHESEGLYIYMHSSDTDFMIKSGFPLKPKAGVSLEYLAYVLLQNKHIHNFAIQRYGRNVTDDAPYLLNSRLIVDHPDRQASIVNNAVEVERSVRLAVLTADKERYNLLQAGSDLIHMLGTPLSKQTTIISRVNKYKDNPSSAQYNDAVTALVDVSSYIQRIIRAMEADYQKVACVKEKKSLTKLLNDYCRAWKNFGATNFELTTDICEEDLFSELNETQIMVMIDTILDNARRHGFAKTYSAQNLVNICLSSTSYNEKPFALLTIANNGAPLNEEFGVKGFISRGHFDGKSGRSGLGGYHIYSIVKKHGGFMTIRKDEQWNFILDILLPLSKECKSSNYSIYGYETV